MSYNDNTHISRISSWWDSFISVGYKNYLLQQVALIYFFKVWFLLIKNCNEPLNVQQVKAVNSAGEGDPSSLLVVSTLEGGKNVSKTITYCSFISKSCRICKFKILKCFEIPDHFPWFFTVLQCTKNIYRHINRIFKFQYFSMFSKHVSYCHFKVCSQSFIKSSHYNKSCEFAKNELQNYKLRSQRRGFLRSRNLVLL